MLKCRHWLRANLIVCQNQLNGAVVTRTTALPGSPPATCSHQCFCSLHQLLARPVQLLLGALTALQRGLITAIAVLSLVLVSSLHWANPTQLVSISRRHSYDAVHCVGISGCPLYKEAGIYNALAG